MRRTLVPVAPHVGPTAAHYLALRAQDTFPAFQAAASALKTTRGTEDFAADLLVFPDLTDRH